jgi:hypothetical protein
MGTESNPHTSATDVSGEIAAGARLFIHLKENNVQYLLGMILAYQIGILDKVFNYGVGICGI